MISSADKNEIIRLCRQYNVAKALLFGSAVSESEPSNDIDLAVEGIRPDLFFKFYGELILALSKPVDVIDLAPDTKFNSLIRRTGVPIYG